LLEGVKWILSNSVSFFFFLALSYRPWSKSSAFVVRGGINTAESFFSNLFSVNEDLYVLKKALSKNVNGDVTEIDLQSPI
jgi:hypothetical protein